MGSKFTKTLPALVLLAIGLTASAIECPVGTLQLDGKCIPCKPGTYSFTPEGSSRRACLPCPPGTSQPASGALGRDICRACWPGTYADEKGSTQCKPCPPGLWSYYGAHKCESCPPGSAILPKSKGCEPCPYGSYSSDANSVRCTKCPLLTTTTGLGATSRADCKPCDSGRYCDKCLVSRYYQYYEPYNVTDFSESYMCRKCPSGTEYKGFKAISSVLQCRPCPVGQYRDSKQRHYCALCQNGRTTAAPGGMLCKKEDDPCPADTYETGDGNCRFCDRGYRFIPEKKTCKRCPSGTVSKGRLSTKCYKCPNNMIPDIDQTKCGCQPGYERKNNRCIPCPAGYHNDWTGGYQTCRQCVLGIAASEGTVQCKTCPLGLVPNKDYTACTKCPPGLMPNILREVDYESYEWGRTGHTHCVVPQTQCPVAEVRYDFNNMIRFCRDRYCTRENDKSDLGVTCKGCGKGQFISSGNDCDYCEEDSVSDGGLSTECTPCQNGTLAVGEGDICGCSGSNRIDYGMQDGVCKKCPVGFYSSYYDEVCKPCEASQFLKDGKCKYCPRFRVPSEDRTKCVTCPPGTKPNRAGRADKCV